MSNKKQKHLTLDERNIIEQGLNSKLSLKSIALKIQKDPTTVSKEIKKHRIYKEPTNYMGYSNICINRYTCTKKNVCYSFCKKKCSNCSLCNSKCTDFSKEICPNTTRFPYTCNACSKRTACRLEKYYYRALISFNNYKTKLSETRTGIHMSEEELCKLDAIVSPLVKQGQSIAHIHSTHNIPCTSATLYNYISKNYLSVGNLDLHRKVKFKSRKKKRVPAKDTSIRNGRTYVDFVNYTENHPDISIVEMDIVEGKKGGKVLLILFLRNTKLMLAFILNDKTANSVLTVFNNLEKALGNELFEKTFPVILTDNGSEFSNPLSLEFNNEGVGRTRIFYCNPTASYQKGAIEKNHEFIRYVIPKGTPMDEYEQADIDLMINHINSLSRKSLNWSSPYDLAKLLLDKKVFKKLNLNKISTSEIKLTPKLLKKN